MVIGGTDTYPGMVEVIGYSKNPIEDYQDSPRTDVQQAYLAVLWT